MRYGKTVMNKWLAGAPVLVVLAIALSTSNAQAQSLTQRIANLEAEIKALKEAAQSEAQAAEDRAFKQVIEEVVEDAKKRQVTSGVFSGYDGEFFLQALDENNGKTDEEFRLNLHGQFQFRHITNHQGGRADETDSGFQARRVKLGIDGHVHTPIKNAGDDPQEITYSMTIETSRSTGNISLEEYSVGFTDVFDSGVDIAIGKTKIPFLHEELVSSKRQLAVDRSSVNEFFTVDRSEQVQFKYKEKKAEESVIGVPWSAAISIHDGARTEMSEFNADPVEVGMAGRIEVALMGRLKQYSDFSDKRGASDDTMLVIGGAWVYQLGDPANGDGVTGTTTGPGEGATEADANYFAWTLDAGYEQGPFGITGAVMGGHIDSRYDAQGAADRDMYGFLATARYGLSHLIDHDIEAFFRYEWINDGAAATEHAQFVTVGANWYHWGHHAKLTTDVVWFFDGDVPVRNPFGANAFTSGLGMSGIGSANANQAVVFRTQYQLYF